MTSITYDSAHAPSRPHRGFFAWLFHPFAPTAPPPRPRRRYKAEDDIPVNLRREQPREADVSQIQGRVYRQPTLKDFEPKAPVPPPITVSDYLLSLTGNKRLRAMRLLRHGYRIGMEPACSNVVPMRMAA